MEMTKCQECKAVVSIREAVVFMSFEGQYTKREVWCVPCYHHAMRKEWPRETARP